MKINVPKDVGANNNVFPVGIYRFQINAQPKVEKANTSDNMIIKPEYTCTSVSGPNGEKIQGRKLWDNWVVAAQCLPIWNNSFKALTGADLPAGDFEIDEFINLVTSRVTSKECILDLGLQYQKKDASGKYIKCGADDPEVIVSNVIKKALPIGGAQKDQEPKPANKARR